MQECENCKKKVGFLFQVGPIWVCEKCFKWVNERMSDMFSFRKWRK